MKIALLKVIAVCILLSVSSAFARRDPSDNSRDPYEVLGLRKGAKEDEVKKKATNAMQSAYQR